MTGASAEVTFRPAISFSQGYTDNVEISGIQKTSDNATSLTVTLPVVQSLRSTALFFTYSAAYQRFNDQESLDHDQHRLRLGLSKTIGPRSSFSVSTRFARTQYQGEVLNLDAADLQATGVEDLDLDPLNLDEGELFLTRRTERDTVGVDFGYSKQQTARWSWRFGVGASDWTNRDIAGFSSGGGDFNAVEDRSAYRGSAGFARAVSRSTSLGASYLYRHSDLDVDGTEDTSSVVMTVSHRLGRSLTFGAEVGGFHSTGAAADGAGTADSRSGFRATVSLKRVYRRVALGLAASHAPSSGGNLPGTSTDSSIGIGLAGLGAQNWNWTVGARFARRDPSEPDLPKRDAVGLFAATEWRFGRLLGLRLGSSYVEQTNNEPMIEDPSIFRASLGMVWYPLGHTELGGRRQ